MTPRDIMTAGRDSGNSDEVTGEKKEERGLGEGREQNVSTRREKGLTTLRSLAGERTLANLERLKLGNFRGERNNTVTVAKVSRSPPGGGGCSDGEKKGIVYTAVRGSHSSSIGSHIARNLEEK